MLTRRIALNAGDLNAIMDLETALHPQGDLTDVYKLLCQAYYGPSHMGKDLAVIQESLIEELDKKNRRIYLPLIQDIGNRKGFYRISLDLIPLFPAAGQAPVPISKLPKKVNKLKPEPWQIELVASMILDSCLEMDVDIRSWKSTWRRLWSRIEARYKPSPDIAKTVQEHVFQGATTHHSKLFKTSYQPHYRILHHKVLKRAFDIDA